MDDPKDTQDSSSGEQDQQDPNEPIFPMPEMDIELREGLTRENKESGDADD
jgi:hypothetical protein